MQLGGIYWQNFRNFPMPLNSFDQLFSNDSVSLLEVLDDDNVVQELKNQNSKLIEL
jgi:hypothetical protein